LHFGKRHSKHQLLNLAYGDVAQQLIDRETRIEMSAHDFDAFAAALNQPWQPNAALQRALQAADAVKRA
jgi:uncharacterized protein (DUF1778 family)